jgi:hypothetical protein
MQQCIHNYYNKQNTRAGYFNIQASQQALSNMARWEEKTQRRIVDTQVQQVAAVLRADAKAALHERRQRLAHHLAEDERKVRAEIDTRQETSEQRRVRLTLHARAHKAKREAVRQEKVEEAYRLRFRRDCDDLRHIDSEHFSNECHAVQTQQRAGAAKQRELESTAKAEWEARQAAGWKEMTKEDTAIERTRADETRRNYDALASQVADKRSFQDEIQRQKQSDNEQRVQDLAAAAVRQREEEVMKFAKQRETNRTIMVSNQQAQQRRLAAEKAQRAGDARDLERDMRLHKIEVEEEHFDKQARQREMEDYRHYLAAKKREESSLEEHIQYMCDEELARANAKRDAEWERERLAREALKSNVLEGRAMQLAEKERLAVAQAEVKARENHYLAAEAGKAAAMTVAEEDARQNSMRQRAAEFKMQIELNNQRLAIEESRRRQDERNADRANNDYLKMLADAKAEKHVLRKPRGIKNMEFVV